LEEDCPIDLGAGFDCALASCCGVRRFAERLFPLLGASIGDVVVRRLSGGRSS